MIHCSAHRIIESLKVCRKSAADETAYKAISLDLDKSQKFCFDFEFSAELTEFGFAAFNDGLLLPPYELSYFEFISTQCPVHSQSQDVVTHWALLIKNFGESILIEAFERCDELDEKTGAISVRNLWLPISTLRVVSVKGSDKPEVFALPSSWPSLDFENRGRSEQMEERLTLIRDFALRAAFGYMAALESKSVSTRANDVSRKLNTARVAKGKPPLFEYRSASLILPSVRTEKVDGSPAGTHAPPRMHWRRGHIRTLPSGRKVPVSPCLVGASENGMLAKEYRASLRRTMDQCQS